MERLRRFWLTGTCNPKKEEKKASEPLAPEQFLSAFFLLLCGIFLSVGLMGMEHAYIKWIRGKVVKTDEAGCCALVSRVSGGKSSENLLLTAEISFEKLMESCDEVIFKYCTRSEISRNATKKPEVHQSCSNRPDIYFYGTATHLSSWQDQQTAVMSWMGQKSLEIFGSDLISYLYCRAWERA